MRPYLVDTNNQITSSVWKWFSKADPGEFEGAYPLNQYSARGTFAGNIYRQVKDPNLVASLTGHAEGSRAFNRYREIDLGMKQDLVKILENKKGWKKRND